MERSIVTGRSISDLGSGIWDFLRGTAARLDISSISRRQIENPKSKIQNAKGFSLLELMIAMFILIILLSVAIPTYQRTVLQARETVLKENLWQMRRAIDQFTADKGKMPASIDELVEGQYLREKPVDPITGDAEWKEETGENTIDPDGEQGLKNVKSLAEGDGSD